MINEKYCNGEVEEETVEALQAFCDARGIELCTEDVPQDEWYDCEPVYPAQRRLELTHESGIRERESRYLKTA